MSIIAAKAKTMRERKVAMGLGNNLTIASMAMASPRLRPMDAPKNPNAKTPWGKSKLIFSVRPEASSDEPQFLSKSLSNADIKRKKITPKATFTSIFLKEVSKRFSIYDSCYKL